MIQYIIQFQTNLKMVMYYEGEDFFLYNSNLYIISNCQAKLQYMTIELYKKKTCTSNRLEN